MSGLDQSWINSRRTDQGKRSNKSDLYPQPLFPR